MSHREEHRQRVWLRITTILICCGITVRLLSADGPDAVTHRTIQLHGLPDDEQPVVSTVAIHPHDRFIATAGDDHIVRIWEKPSGRLVRELAGHRDWVTSVAFNHDGTELLTGSRDKTVVIWDVESGRKKGLLGEHQHAVTSIVVGTDGFVAVSAFRSPLKIYHLPDRQLLSELRCPCSDVRAVAFSPGMNFLAAGGRNGKLRIWDLKTGRVRDIVAHNRRIATLLFAAGDNILSAGEESSIKSWNAESGQLNTSFSMGTGKALDMVSLSPTTFAVGTTDNMIRLFALDTPEPLGTLSGHTGSIATLAARHGTLISGSFDTTVRVWTMSTMTQTRHTGLDTD